jgi:hypothetical protein
MESGIRELEGFLYGAKGKFNLPGFSDSFSENIVPVANPSSWRIIPPLTGH